MLVNPVLLSVACLESGGTPGAELFILESMGDRT
jgi:hypothetical protein